MTREHFESIVTSAVLVGIGVTVLTIVVAASQAPPRPAEPDPWSITAEDDAAVLATYRTAAGNLDDKLRAAVKADRARLKARVVVQSAKPARRVWLTVDGGQTLIDLDVYTSVVVGATEVEFRESGFTTLRVPRTDGLVAHVRAYYGGVDLNGKEGEK